MLSHLATSWQELDSTLLAITVVQHELAYPKFASSKHSDLYRHWTTVRALAVSSH
jgi:hypothetical protein